MLKTGHPIEPEDLMAYLDGELEATRACVAAEHLERCSECRGLAEDLRGVSRGLMAWRWTNRTFGWWRSGRRCGGGGGDAGIRVSRSGGPGLRWWACGGLRPRPDRNP